MIRTYRTQTWLFAACLLLGQGVLPHTAHAANPTPQITLSIDTEDGEKLIIATVMNGQTPIEGVDVSIGVQRKFGVLVLGVDTTLDDGTAAVEFPAALPGDENGHILVIASVNDSATLAAAVGKQEFSGVRAVPKTLAEFPQALWSPRKLWPLIAVISVLAGGVWITFSVVVSLLVRIYLCREESTS